MVGANLMEELDCGNFFDHIDDLLEFPSDDFDAGLLGGCGDCDAFASVFPDGSSSEDALLGFDSVFSGNRAAADLSAELAVPYEDIVQLEWMSNFMDDSFSGGAMTEAEKMISVSSSSSPKDSSQAQFQTSSPVSVLESSSSCSDSKAVPVLHEKRARSKRPRPATFNPRPAIQLISPSSSFTENPFQAVFIPCASAESGVNSAESRPFQKVAGPVQEGDQPKKKKKKTKNAPPSYPGVTNANAAPLPVRKCLHCEITKTPQWRAGPMGPKTLCNACGVRYKSGRLFPEYRPAASPTFIPSVHSNSHKKVVEMRISGFTENISSPATPTVTQQQPQPVPIPIPQSDFLSTRG